MASRRGHIRGSHGLSNGAVRCAHQLEKALAEEGLSKSELARRMQTSRPALDRLLDPENESVTLATLEKAARAVGRTLRLELLSKWLRDRPLEFDRPRGTIGFSRCSENIAP